MSASDFNFDEKLPPQENIRRFLAHLDTVNPDMAALLRANVGKLLPLPVGNERTVKRAEFNRCIMEALDAITTLSGDTTA